MSTLEEKFAALRSRLQASPRFRCFEIANTTNVSILDYAPHEEAEVKERLKLLLAESPGHYVHVNLYELCIKLYLEQDYTQEALDEIVLADDPSYVKEVVGQIFNEIQVKDIVAEIASSLRSEHDILFISGIGEAYPMVEAFTLLNHLPNTINRHPIILLYPGTYTGNEIRLFNTLQPHNYYRAAHVN